MDLEDFKSFCRVLKPSGVGSIPTHSRHRLSLILQAVERSADQTMVQSGGKKSQWAGAVRCVVITALVLVMLCAAGGRFDA